jgi:PAS domain S-box-containing protein
VVEANERIVAINDACVRLLGYTSAMELVGQPVSILSLSPQSEQLLKQDRSQSNDRSPKLLLAKRKDGTFIPLEVTAVGLALAGTTHQLMILRDTTASTNPTVKKLEGAGVLTNRAAHDLNNLLAAIRCQTELVLVYETVPPSVREMLQKVLSAAQRASDITRQ